MDEQKDNCEGQYDLVTKNTEKPVKPLKIKVTTNTDRQQIIP